jgi:hypothetical protein
MLLCSYKKKIKPKLKKNKAGVCGQMNRFEQNNIKEIFISHLITS